jgi:hypothetical protein
MAVSKPTTDLLPRPQWPAQSIDPVRVYVHYDRVADELVVHFAGWPILASSFGSKRIG